MRNLSLITVLVFLVVLAGCAMWRAQKSITPPGGCDQCHVIPISANWQLVVKAAVLTDEATGTPPWQREESISPPKPTTSARKEIRGQQCFACHTGADAIHSGYSGTYH